MAQKQDLSRKISKLFNSKNCFRLVLIIFAIEALWIAFSSVYPMAFDEDFHLGIIRLYASHISPFWIKQPAGADSFGAIARDPSYLYQYLMSFPYRLITLFTHSQSVVVIFLRLINIALFGSGLYLFKRLLDKTGASIAKVNFTLLIFILLPVVPFLAAQINYDNLFFPLTALVLIMTIDAADYLFKKKVSATLLIELLILCLLTSLVKYAFLPIFIIVTCYIIFEVIKNLGLASFYKEFSADLKKIKALNKALLILGLLISFTLFYQRFGVNIVKYHTPIPDCSKVLSIEECKEYGPWIRDYDFKLNKVDTEIGTEKNILTFTADWFDGMWLRTFFTLSGPGQTYQTRGPIPIPGISAIAFALFGLVACLMSIKKILKRYNAHHTLFLILMALSYTAALWLDEYNAYLETGQPVAINGRYIFPVILPLILLFVIGASIVIKRAKTKAILAVICIICLAYGGGALTFILRSNDSWYWNSSLVRDSNHVIQNVIGPIMPGYNDPAIFL